WKQNTLVSEPRYHLRMRTVLVLFALALLGPLSLSRPASAQGELAPDAAYDTFNRLKFRCKLLLCPYSPEVWELVGNAVANKPADAYLLGVYLMTGDKVPRDERSGQQRS